MSGPAETTVDAFLGGRFRLVQPVRGHRSGSDAIFLAASVPADAAGTVVDLGAGPGAVGFAVAARARAADLALVDVSGEAVALVEASRALPANAALSGRIGAVRGDVADPPGRWTPPLPAGAAAYVLANPPFFDAARHNQPSDPARRLARSMPAGGLEAWVKAARRLLGPGGRFVAIVPPAALTPLIAALGRGFGGPALFPLFPGGGAPAKRLVVAAVRDGRQPLRVLPGLVVHGAGGGYTPAAEAILREAAPLAADLW